jgi:sulfide:quinone oxidoreductase
VVAASGTTEDGWIPVDLTNLRTRFPGVYAVGDVAEIDVPKVGDFSEGAARVAALSIIADLDGARSSRLGRGWAPAASSSRLAESDGST